MRLRKPVPPFTFTISHFPTHTVLTQYSHSTHTAARKAASIQAQHEHQCRLAEAERARVAEESRRKAMVPRVVDGGVTATGVLSRERGNLITISITLY